MSSVMLDTLWEVQHEIIQDKTLLGIMHIFMGIDLHEVGDVLTMTPILSMSVSLELARTKRQGVLRSAAAALVDYGQVGADYGDLGFKMCLGLDPWETQDRVVGCAVEAVKTLGFDLQQRPTGRWPGRISRPMFDQFLRDAPHLMMLARSLEDGHITSRRGPPHVMFSDPTSTGAVQQVGSWCSSRPREYDALLHALTAGVMLRRSWETP